MSFVILLGPVKALLVAALVFVPFEQVKPMHAGQPVLRRGVATDLLTGIANGLVLYVPLLLLLGMVDAGATAAAPELRQWIAGRALWLQVALALAIGDLGVYAIHRLTHTVPWLWRFHAVHHSAEEMDWLVGFRFHAVDLLLVRVASLAPVVALNVTPAAIGVLIAVFGWQSWLNHANLRVPYGPLRWVLVSPEFHHWHHSTDRDAFDKNYATLFACWDVLFGTVHLPRGRQPLRYGIEERVPAGYVGRFVHAFRRERPAGALPTESRHDDSGYCPVARSVRL